MGLQMPYFLNGGKMVKISITAIIAATMLMFMIGCGDEETDSGSDDTAVEEEVEATVRYH